MFFQEEDGKRDKHWTGGLTCAHPICSGSALPAKAVSNAELAERVDTNDEWIGERTDIRNRYIADESETTSTLATLAAQRALESAGIDPARIDPIILATATSAQTLLANSTSVHRYIGYDCGFAFALAAVCSRSPSALGAARCLALCPPTEY